VLATPLDRTGTAMQGPRSRLPLGSIAVESEALSEVGCALGHEHSQTRPDMFGAGGGTTESLDPPTLTPVAHTAQPKKIDLLKFQAGRNIEHEPAPCANFTSEF
jgi:hypothetical protein